MSLTETLGLVGFFLSSLLSIRIIVNMFTRIRISNAEVRIYASPPTKTDVIYFDLTMTNMSEFPVSVTGVTLNFSGHDFEVAQHEFVVLARGASTSSSKPPYEILSTPLPINLQPKLSSVCRFVVRRPHAISLQPQFDILIPEDIVNPFGEELKTQYSGNIPFLSVCATMSTSRKTISTNFEATVCSIHDSIARASVRSRIAASR